MAVAAADAPVVSSTMPSAHESLSNNEAERLLASLAGVVSAHVVTDAAGRIVEIHILSAAELHPKQVVRNVESALSAGLGIEIDRRVVSVAQIRTPGGEAGSNGHGRSAARQGPPGTGDDDDAPSSSSQPAPRQPNGRPSATPRPDSAPSAGAGTSPAPSAAGREAPRLEYVRFQAKRDAERCTCEVTLRDGDREVVGSGAGPDTAAGRSEAAARAVLAAIEKARPQLRLELEGAVISASRGRSFLIVSARALMDRMTVPLAGAAPLARSPEEAGILAALQATNRWSG